MTNCTAAGSKIKPIKPIIKVKAPANDEEEKFSDF
jgi:hypothetical protein